MRKIALSLTVATMLVFLVAAQVPASAAVTLDQSQESTFLRYSIWADGASVLLASSSAWAQTFTPSRSGHLDHVSLDVGYAGTNYITDDLTVEIHPVDASGAPAAQILGAGVIASTLSQGTGPESPQWRDVAVGSPLVSAGTQYAIVAYTWGGPWAWQGYESGSTGPYTGGSAYRDLPVGGAWDFYEPSDDLAFRTYMSPNVADLAVTATASSSAKTRSLTTDLFTVINHGPDPANSVVLTINLPSGAQYSSVATTDGTCTRPGRKVQQVTCQLGALASGDSSTSSVTVKIGLRPAEGPLVLAASVLTTEADDPDTANNSTSASTTVTR